MNTQNLNLIFENYISRFEQNIHSITSPAISTGVSGYKATAVAMSTVKKWLDENGNYFMEVIFCCFSKQAYDVYQSYAMENNIFREV